MPLSPSDQQLAIRSWRGYDDHRLPWRRGSKPRITPGPAPQYSRLCRPTEAVHRHRNFRARLRSGSRWRPWPRRRFAGYTADKCSNAVCHPPLIEIHSTLHRVAKVSLPAVARVDIRQRRSDAAFRHDRVRFSQQGLTDQGRFRATCRGLDRRSQTRNCGRYERSCQLWRAAVAELARDACVRSLHGSFGQRTA